MPGAPEPGPPVFLRGPVLLIDGQAVLWDVNTQVPDPATAIPEAAISQCLATWDEDTVRVFELMKNKPEIVVFGTGRTLLPLPQRLRQVFTSNGMQVEVASTRNACSTFNVLVAEGRHVAACLLPLAPSSPLKEEPKPSKSKQAADSIAGVV
ncbi:NADH dehydrogenase 1 alpha subcomplex assembly factor 3 [Catenaria anguillulae PL171]|uniref:NADH dehydrogenase 1 alpha subcomplex assembly factor 3 n=1 Tax=Catenaria anguillulae PL171 TaxID=765915 RepID=A0A1Y2I4I5_9FUNG|nr:NADH dehydrogenase 1 alpha subcomplex assembly factor 3 [Catenaria anguillulae PL171]